MSVFRRRKDQAGAGDRSEQSTGPGGDRGPAQDVDPGPVTGDGSGADDGSGQDDGSVRDAGASPVPVEPVRPHGPWDVEDEPDDAVVRLDLGSMRIPGAPGMEIQVNLDEAGGSVVAVTAVMGDSTLQLQAFAAPRREGIWAEVRRELAAEITKDGGLADPEDSPLGPSLRARIPFPQPTGGSALAPVLFIGCDGPRWFLRGVLTGPAASDTTLAEPLLAVFTGTVVVRGSEAHAPREALPLRLPVADSSGDADADADAGGQPRPVEREPLDLSGTGQQITEIR